MIQPVNGSGTYNIYETQNNKAIDKTEEKCTSVSFKNQIQEMLSQLGDYAYNEEDVKGIKEDVVTQLKEKLNLSQEEIGKLNKNGFDLEKLLTESQKSSSNMQEKTEDEDESKKQNTAYKISVISQRSDSVYLYGLKNKGNITINSLYQSHYKGNFKKVATNYSEEDINNILKMNGLPNTEGNQWAAGKLMEYGMDVTPSQVTKLQNIEAAIKGLQDYTGQDDEKVLMKNDALNYNNDNVVRITDDLGMVTDEYIEHLVNEKEDITIGDLRDSIHKNSDIVLHGENHEETISSVSTDSVQSAQISDNMQQEAGAQSQQYENAESNSRAQSVEEVKRQIDQIRAMLTTEAAQRISQKMPLESSKLSDVAKMLNEMQTEEATKAAVSVNLEPTEENVETIKQVMTATSQIERHPEWTVWIELNTDQEATLKEVQSALTAYAENELVPQARFNESFRKIEDQVDQVLQGQGIEVNEKTLQAAKALITNQIEVTPKTIQEVLSITQKINTFLEEMTPNQAATMIKEGVNPYEASIDETLEWISKEKIPSLKQSVAESIVALEDKKAINEEQKNTLIGLYRILNAVENNKEEVAGYLYKNDLTLTTEHLQQAAKYVHKNKTIDAKIDNNFGALQDAEYKKETAKNLIEKNMQQNSKMLEIIRTLEEMELPITDENLNKLSKLSAMMYPYIKEQFKKELGKFDGLDTLPQSFLEKMEYVKNVSSTTLEKMIDQDIPLTISNIYWVDQIEQNPTIYAEFLNENGMLKEELPKNLDEIEDQLKKLEKAADDDKVSALEKGDFLKYKSAKKIEEMIQVQKQLVDKEGLYQIPFVIDGQTKLVNVYIDKNASGQLADNDGFKAMISYDTNTMGKVKAYVQIKGDHIGYRVEGETSEATQKLRSNSNELEKLLSDIGYHIAYTHFEETKEEDTTILSPIKHDDSQFEEIV